MTEYKSERNTLLFLIEEDVVQEITVGFQDAATPDNLVGKTGIRDLFIVGPPNRTHQDARRFTEKNNQKK